MSVTSKARRAKSKFLSAYYGNPIKDMKLICITGTTGKTTVAHFVHEILRAADIKVAILASDYPIKSSTLHKFLNQAWKAQANYVIVTAEATSLSRDVFYGLPVHVAALTDFIPAKLTDLSTPEYLSRKSTLFKMHPKIVILNCDDANYQDFAQFKGATDTITYGKDRSSYVRIDNHKLYKQGTEANLAIGTKNFTVASFVAGEPTVSYMACAAAIATSLHISPVTITEGIANYEPEEPKNTEPKSPSKL